MSLQACANIVARGDPDRFAAAMAAPVEARRVLFPLYAFNVEVARAPWVASEPMIGEMRLQWWRDVLDEVAEARPVRRHEVATPLSDVLDKEGAADLRRLVDARRWDLYTDPFEDTDHFWQYLDAGGHLMWTAARLLGGTDAVSDPVVRYGRATALTRFLGAVPELEARGRVPLLDGRRDAVAALAKEALAALPSARSMRVTLPGPARAALIEGWQTRALLKKVARSPGIVADGQCHLGEFRKRALLVWAAF